MHEATAAAGQLSTSPRPPLRPPPLPSPPPGADGATTERRGGHSSARHSARARSVQVRGESGSSSSPPPPSKRSSQADADSGAGLEVHRAVNQDLCTSGSKELQSEVQSLVQHVHALGQRLADAERERNSKTDVARQMQEALDKETARAEAAQADTEAARRRFEALQRVLRQAASLDGSQHADRKAPRHQKSLSTDAADDLLGPGQHLAIAEAENRALLGELAKARDHAASSAEIAECRKVLAEQRPLVEALRGKLTERYVENEMLRSQIAQIRAARGQASGDDRWAVSRWQGGIATGFLAKGHDRHGEDVGCSGRSSPRSAENVEALSEAGSEFSETGDAMSDSWCRPECDVFVRVVV